MSYKPTPITSKIQKGCKGGITQPILNMGAPVKMKMKSPALATKPKDGDKSSNGKLEYYDGAYRSPGNNRRRKAIFDFFGTAGSVIKSAGEGALRGGVLGPVGQAIGAGMGAIDAGVKAKAKAKAKAKTTTTTTTTKTNKKDDLSMTPYSTKNGKGTINGPKVSYDMAYEKAKKTKRYKDMSKEDYITESKRQTKVFKETGKWDTKPKRAKVEKVSTLKPASVKPVKTATLETKLDPKELKTQVAKVNSNKEEPSKRDIRKSNRKAKSSGRASDRAARARLKGQQALENGNTRKALRLKRKETRLKEKATKKAKQAKQAIE
tara:strand:- start:2781 stop:3743 length:963 start_codon:yes stop_codon:yes gene_type:complete